MLRRPALRYAGTVRRSWALVLLMATLATCSSDPPAPRAPTPAPYAGTFADRRRDETAARKSAEHSAAAYRAWRRLVQEEDAAAPAERPVISLRRAAAWDLYVHARRAASAAEAQRARHPVMFDKVCLDNPLARDCP